MDTKRIESLKTRQILNRRFVVLRKIYLFGVFPKLLCTLRDENDGYVTEKRIPFKLRKYEYPTYGDLLTVKIDKETLTYLVTKEARDWLDLYDKPVFWKVSTPEPYFEGLTTTGG